MKNKNTSCQKPIFRNIPPFFGCFSSDFFEDFSNYQINKENA